MSSYQSYSSGMGERILNIGEFRGIDQSRGDHGVDYGTSPDAVNFISRYGKLYTAGGTALYGAPAGLEEDCQGRLCQAFFRNPQGEDTTKLLMFANGCIYAAGADASEWVQIGSGFHSDNWDVVNYRDGISDLAIMTNGLDNVQYWDGWSSSVSMLLNAEEVVEEETEEEPDSDIEDVPPLEDEDPSETFKPDYTVDVGSTIELVAFGILTDSDNNLEHPFSIVSSDSSIATVSPGTVDRSDEVITVTGVAPGDVSISASSSHGFLASVNVGVRLHCTSVSIELTDLEGNSLGNDGQNNLSSGKTYKIKCTSAPGNNTDSIALKSDNESVAVVSDDGILYVRNPGTANIVCTASDSNGVHYVEEYPIVAYLPQIALVGETIEEPREGTLRVADSRVVIVDPENPEFDYVSWTLIYHHDTSKYGLRSNPGLDPNGRYSDFGYSRVNKTADDGSVIVDDYNYFLLYKNILNNISGIIPENGKIIKCEADFAYLTEYVGQGGPLVAPGTGGSFPAPPEYFRTQFSFLSGDVNVDSAVNAFKNRNTTPEGWVDITDDVLQNNSLAIFRLGNVPEDILYNGKYYDQITGSIKFRVVVRYNTDGSELEVIVPVAPTKPDAIKQGNDTLIFSQIALLRERLWGAVSPFYPDRIYWSNTFDPNDWELNWEDSSNVGGGFIDIATFDGTRIRAILTAFDEILVFKDKSIHRITGSVPGEFSVGSVYSSEGTLAPRSIVYTGDKVYFLSVDGLCVYNGVTATPLSSTGDRKLKNIWSRINESTISTACAVLKDNIIYLAVPLDGSIINTHVIEYNLYDGTYSIVELPGVDDWLLMREGQKETLLFLDGNGVYQYDIGYTFAGEPINAYWISPEISGSSMSARKTTGRIYMRIEARSLDISKQPYIKLTMSNGVKSREKLIRLNNGMNDIRKRIKIRGRTFRFKIENVDGNPITIHRGVEICTEEDFD